MDIEDAVLWFQEVLDEFDGVIPGSERDALQLRAEKEGYDWSMMKEARKRLGVVPITDEWHWEVRGAGLGGDRGDNHPQVVAAVKWLRVVLKKTKGREKGVPVLQLKEMVETQDFTWSHVRRAIKIVGPVSDEYVGLKLP